MKNLLHDISIWMFALIMIGTQSCSDDLQITDHVEVSFVATLPADVRTRSFGDAGQVNTLIVGIFDVQKKEIDRKEFEITDNQIDVCLTLAQSQTYNFIFWVYDNTAGAYDINNLTAIKMNTPAETVTFSQEESTDAFFAVEEDITVTGSANHEVTLKRPLVQINVGTSGAPQAASFTAKSAPDTFHPFSNTVGGKTDFTWTFSETSDEKFSVDGKEYTYLAIGYLFAPTTSTTIEAELTLTGGQTGGFPQVEIGANRKSNIVGSFTVE